MHHERPGPNAGARATLTCCVLTCQDAGASLVDKLPSPNLTEQQQNIGKVILGLIAFQVLIGFISSAMSGGGGGGGYSV